MKKGLIFWMASAILLVSFTMTGCRKPKPQPEPTQGKYDLAVVSMLANPDGMSGTSWLQIIDGLSEKNVTNAKARQIGFGMPPMGVIGNDIYTIPDYGASNTFEKWTRSKDGSLTKTAEMELPVNSFASHGLLVSAEKGYLGTMTGKVLIFNPTTMQLTGDIDISSYAIEGVLVPAIGAPFVDGDKVYMPLWQVDANRMPVGDPMIDMLVVDLKTDTVIKRIQETNSGLTNAGYPYGIQRNCFKDEMGDIYYIAGGAFSINPKYKSGILRIKNGSTEIDPGYNWVFNDQTIEGENGKASWLVATHYLGNGKLFGYADVPDYWTNPAMPDWVHDRSIISVEIDIWNKTVKKLPIPHTCAYSTHVSSYDDQMLFSVWGEQGSGFYTYDPKTGKVSDGPAINMPGFAFWAYQFKD